MQGKASGNSLFGSKRFQVIGGGGALFTAITLLDVFPEGETIRLMGQEMEMTSIIILLSISLALLYGVQDIVGTVMDGIVKASESNNNTTSRSEACNTIS